MSDILSVNAIEQLKPFLNEKNILEIVVREKNKRVKAFQKVVLNDLPQGEEKKLLEKAIHELNKATDLSTKKLDMLRNIAKVQNLGIVLNGLNLCATCAGFAIMYDKLDKMGEEIGRQFAQLESVVKRGMDVDIKSEFRKIAADYRDMLDSRRRLQPYSEEKMRDLVDQEANILQKLIDVLKEEITTDTKTIIDSIFSMLSMFTVSLRYYDEQYYFNNCSVLGDADVWHSSHEIWMRIYDTLSSDWFVEKLQDFGMFESRLTTVGVDIYYTMLLEQIADLRQEVEDNQSLIIAVGDIDLLRQLREYSQRDIKETIEKAFSEVLEEAQDPAAEKVFQDAMAQVGW